MIVSRVASEFIRNTNKTEDSNKNRKEICKNDETTPKYVGNTLQERKQQKKSEFQKLTQNILVYDELSLNLEPKVNDVQLSYNFKYSVISTEIDRI
jgi:hypothetical protein